jgi:DNA primase
MWWEQPDGTLGLGGLRTEDLPLYGAAAAARWDLDQPVIVVEGEKAAHALAHAGWQAVGTATGASGCPSREALAVLAGCRVVLWPDNDQAGGLHMLRLARVLGEPGEIAAAVAWVHWPDAPPGADAADALAAGADVAALVAAAGVPQVYSDEVPVDPPGRTAVRKPRRDVTAESPIERFNAVVGVSTVLARQYGLDAAPGRTVRCPAHEDRHASLSVLPDDRRVFCHSPGCPLNDGGRGADAWALQELAGAAR